MEDATKIFKRHDGGPLLHVKDFPGKAQIYNPAPVQCGAETILLVSVVEHAATKGFGRDVGQTRVARSKDGINFELSEENFIDTQALGEPWDRYHHFIDNRVTKIGDWYYIVTPVMVQGFDSPIGMLGRTKDFKSYERIGTITQPKNRGASLFPEKINGKYYKLDRPGGGDGGVVGGHHRAHRTGEGQGQAQAQGLMLSVALLIMQIHPLIYVSTPFKSFPFLAFT